MIRDVIRNIQSKLDKCEGKSFYLTCLLSVLPTKMVCYPLSFMQAEKKNEMIVGTVLFMDKCKSCISIKMTICMSVKMT